MLETAYVDHPSYLGYPSGPSPNLLTIQLADYPTCCWPPNVFIGHLSKYVDHTYNPIIVPCFVLKIPFTPGFTNLTYLLCCMLKCIYGQDTDRLYCWNKINGLFTIFKSRVSRWPWPSVIDYTVSSHYVTVITHYVTVTTHNTDERG